MRGGRTTIYLPDELWKKTRGLGLNISAICQDALRAEIERKMEELRAAVETGHCAEEALARLNEETPNG